MDDQHQGIERQVAFAVIVLSSLALLFALLWQHDGGAQDRKQMSEKKPVRPAHLSAGQQKQALGLGSGSIQRISGPMLLTVPKLSHLDKSPIPTALGGDEEVLKNHAGAHMKGTGYPWQKGANVYISGHRMGFPGTPSFRAFYRLEDLDKGDEVILTDAGGTDYVYRVYETVEVGPEKVDVTLPVAGKDIVSLQTCTLPDYTRRVIVRGEKVAGDDRGR